MLGIEDAHDDGNKDGWTKALEENVCQRLKDSVRDEEDGQARIVRLCGELEIDIKMGDSSIPNVRSIQKCQQV